MPQVEKYVEVNAPIDKCVATWLDVDSYPLFIKNLEAVRPKKGSENTWFWLTWTPLGKDTEWEVQIENQDTSWYAISETWGAYRCNFVMKTLGPDKTAINIFLEYIPSPEAIRTCGNRISHYPQHILDINLKRLKNLIERPLWTQITPKSYKKLERQTQEAISQHPTCGIQPQSIVIPNP